MPISSILFTKWDDALAQWAEWFYGKSKESEGVSGVYDPDNWQDGYRGGAQTVVLLGDVYDTDKLMVGIRTTHPALYEALDAWARNKGTRSDQAARLSCHPDTYRDKVDSGMRLLEDLSRTRKIAEIKNRRIANDISEARYSRHSEKDPQKD